MGRDDAKPVGVLQGGTAPARAFHDFMVRAVARRPVENFETSVPMPDWQLEPEEEAWMLPPTELGLDPLVDADGNPLPVDPLSPQSGAIRPDGTGTEPSLEEVPGRPTQPQQQPPPNQYPQQRPPAPGSAPPADPSQPGA
jgi:penicillin-binding protein 1A